jgi:hypothetical protein
MASETPAEIWALPEKRKSSAGAGADADLVILNAEGVNIGDHRGRQDRVPQRS